MFEIKNQLLEYNYLSQRLIITNNQMPRQRRVRLWWKITK